MPTSTLVIRTPLIAAAFVLALLGSLAQADPVYYIGIDPGFGPWGSNPSSANSDNAQNQFLAAACLNGAPIRTIDFEDQPLFAFSTLTPAPGVRITSVDNPAGVENGTRTVNNYPLPSHFTLGYNTTPGGSKFLQVTDAGQGTPPPAFVFDFDRPITAFGAMFTGLGTYPIPNVSQVFLDFNDGVARSVELVGSLDGGLEFLGFTTSTPISRVTIRTTAPGEVFGFDDVRYQFVNPTPEPASVLMVGLGLAGLVAYRLHQRSRGQSRSREVV